MTEPCDGSWTARSTRPRTFGCDTLFAINTDIRFCDKRTGHFIPGAAASLPAPDLPMTVPGWVAARDLAGREDELVRHYRRVVRAFDDAARTWPISVASPHFWSRPAIIADGQVVSSFLWYDWVPEAVALFEALVGAPGTADDVILDDLDQGWRVRIVRVGSLVHIVEWDWEDEAAELCGHVFDGRALAREAADALGRLRRTHRHLVDALGHDHWTHHRNA